MQVNSILHNGHIIWDGLYRWERFTELGLERIHGIGVWLDVLVLKILCNDK